MKEMTTSKNSNALKIIATTFGVLVGFFGMEHGFFEILQGNTVTGDIMIHAIGPAQRFWELGTEPALTIIPNFLITGILAMLVGLFIIIWSLVLIEKKYSAWVLLLFSIIMFLVGGGIAPLYMALPASFIASRINKPHKWLKKYLPGRIRNFLASLWPWSLIFITILGLIMCEIAVFGYPLLYFFNAEATLNILLSAGYPYLGSMLFTIITAFAYDTHKQITSSKTNTIKGR